MNNFKKALEQVFFVEGGYSDHPEDKGGKTKYGITEVTYKRWIENNRGESPRLSYMTKIEASAIYREMYWNVVRGDDLPRGLSLMVFDSAVHAGPTKAIKWLQRAVGEKSDGIFGPMTLLAANSEETGAGNVRVVAKIAEYRLMMARGNETFVRGWFNRIVYILAASVEEVVEDFHFSPK